MSSTSSPTRRVLGAKDANASLKMFSPRTAGKALTDPSTLLSPLGRINVTHTRPSLANLSPQAGRKRRISEVDGSEAEEDRHKISASQQTEVMSDVVSEHGGTYKASKTSSPEPATINEVLFSASQQPQGLQEQQFELPADEISQSTLDKMHEVQMPPNISQPEAEQPSIRLYAEGSHLSSGMSSFVDFGGSEPSQRSDKDKSTSPDIQRSVSNVATVESEDERRKSLMDQRAAELRTRLQFAYFKVQTNQTTTPLSRLKVPEALRKVSSPIPKDNRLANNSLANPTILINSSHRRANASEVASLEERISAMRAKATEQDKPSIRTLSSIPIPRINPHPNEERIQHATTTHAHPVRKVYPRQQPDIPSSPPISRSSAEVEEEVSATHRAPNDLETITTSVQQVPVDQLSSPPPSRHSSAEGESQQTPQASLPRLHASDSFATKDTPSSAIKGEVADSLLQLMRGVGSGKGMCGV